MVKVFNELQAMVAEGFPFETVKRAALPPYPLVREHSE